MKISFQNLYNAKNVSAFCKSGNYGGYWLNKTEGIGYKDNEISGPCALSMDTYQDRLQKNAGRIIYYSIMQSLEEKLENVRFYTPKLKKTENILKENKEELIGVLDSSFRMMQDRYCFEPSNFDYTDWQPVMSLDCARNYTKGSRYYNEIYYRGSNSPEAAKDHGYVLSHTNVQYPGIYVTDSKETAAQYGKKPLPLMVRANNSVLLKGRNAFEENLFNALEVNTKNKELIGALRNIEGVVEYGFGKLLNIDAFIRTIQAFPEDVPSSGLVVLNPKNIVIIDEPLK